MKVLYPISKSSVIPLVSMFGFNPLTTTVEAQTSDHFFLHLVIYSSGLEDYENILKNSFKGISALKLERHTMYKEIKRVCQEMK